MKKTITIIRNQIIPYKNLIVYRKKHFTIKTVIIIMWYFSHA
jgi:hypothetical protein